MRSGISYNPVPEQIWSDIRNEEKIVKSLELYHRDTVEQIRHASYYILARIGGKSVDQPLRKTVVAVLCGGIKDRSSGVAGSVLESLTQFRVEDFSPGIKDSVGLYLNENVAHQEKLIRLAGFLQLTHQQQLINSIMQSTKSPDVKWAGRLALARMGNKSAISFLVAKLEQAIVDDNFAYDVVPDLVYTRRAEIFEFLEKSIHSTVRNCQAADPDSNKKIECAFRIIEAIAPAIHHFPFSVDPSGDLDTDDYSTALQTTRAWLQTNPDYQINQNTY